MSKFNEGARVRVIGDWTGNAPVGSEWTVTSYKKGWVNCVVIDAPQPYASYYEEHELELVEAVPFDVEAMAQIDQAIEALMRAKEALR